MICLLAALVLSASVSKWLAVRIKQQVVVCVASMLLLVLCIMNLATSSYNPFIYFRF